MKHNIATSIISQIQSTMRDHITIPVDQAKAFFKTGFGHYAEGDEFIGVNVPNLRKIAKIFSYITLENLQSLISSKINEERLLALLILVLQYDKGACKRDKEEIYQFYLNHLRYVNNWNLVDTSAHLIIGAHLWDKDRSPILALAKSDSLWQRRISIVSTWYFIRHNDLTWTFKIAGILINDRHDLIHKAAGWMLREAGKRNQAALITFLNHHAIQMPRTMLRYAIEKFPEKQRKNYMSMQSGL